MSLLISCVLRSFFVDHMVRDNGGGTYIQDVHDDGCDVRAPLVVVSARSTRFYTFSAVDLIELVLRKTNAITRDTRRDRTNAGRKKCLRFFSRTISNLRLDLRPFGVVKRRRFFSWKK